MLKATIYGFADQDDVERAINQRLSDVNADKKEQLASLLGEAIAALKDINLSIPVHPKSRHLVAGALENFCNVANGS